jgi:lipopolysaccharide/colanic/teichoic acid biosynthesis glycosyltransferase
MKTIESSELLLVPKAAERDDVVYGIELRRREAARRCADLVLSLLLLVLLLPLMLVAALLVKLDSPGPVFFRQRRLGRDRQFFTVLKFRTMLVDAPSQPHQDYIAGLANGRVNGNGLKKLSADPRVTRVGRVLRRLSLDELPQLLNVLAGSMSLIGPRPALEYELEHYQQHHYARFEVRPGITGLWQVSGRNSLGFVEMLDLDVEYATNGTLSTDLRILVRTPVAAVRHAA